MRIMHVQDMTRTYGTSRRHEMESGCHERILLFQQYVSAASSTEQKRLENLEEKIRDWAVADSAIIIICGPIIDKPSKTIGKNKVAVPERFFKVILSPFVKPARGIGFLFNNRQAVEPLSTYAVSIDSIEKLTHMDFFSPLPDELENAVEANADYYQWPR